MREDDARFGSFALLRRASMMSAPGSRQFAHYVGLPRSTVIRKLNEFVGVGVIARYGNAHLLSEERAHNEITSQKRFEISGLRRKFESIQTRHLARPVRSGIDAIWALDKAVDVSRLPR
jgi:hypothetical protein